MIKKLIEKWACKHLWETVNDTHVYAREKDKIPTKVRRTLICKNCGKIKQINM